MLDISSLPIADLSKVYLVSFYQSGKLIEFDKSQKNLKNFLITGGPPPIKSTPVEIGVTCYLLPDGYSNLDEVTELNGYLAQGVILNQPINRTK